MRVAGIVFATILLVLVFVLNTIHPVKGLEYVVALYSLYIAYEVFKPARPFITAISIYIFLIILSKNFRDVYVYMYPVRDYILPFLLSMALIKLEWLQPYMTIAGLSLTAIFGYLITSALPVKGLNLVFLSLMAALIATTVLPLLHRGLEVLRMERGFITGMTTFVFAYLALIRPLLSSRPGLANLIDWIIVISIILKVNSSLKRYIVVEEERGEGVEYRKEEIVEKIEKAKRLFVEKGIKSPLIAVLAEALVSSGFKTDEIARVVSVIISCEDERIPRFAFGWEKRIIERRNRRRREEAIRRIEEILGGVGFGS